MYKGKIVELAPTDELYDHPLHPYTKVLLSAVPIPDPDVEKARKRQIMDPEFDYSEPTSELVEVSPGHFLAAQRAAAL
jgi:oligopeptide transport system ATP-binding protein